MIDEKNNEYSDGYAIESESSETIGRSSIDTLGTIQITRLPGATVSNDVDSDEDKDQTVPQESSFDTSKPYRITIRANVSKK